MYLSFRFGKYVNSKRISTLENDNTDLNTRLVEYESKINKLSLINVHNKSSDISNVNIEAKQILNLLAAQISDNEALDTVAGSDALSSVCFNFLLNLNPKILAIMNIDGTVTLYNETLLAIYGYTSEDKIAERNILEFVLPFEAQNVTEMLENSLSGQQNSSVKCGFMTKYRTNAMELKAPEIILRFTGNPALLIAYVSDDNYNFEELTAKSVWCISRNFNTVFINQKAAELLGYTVDYIKDNKLELFISLNELPILKEFINSCGDGEKRSIDVEVITFKNERRILKADAFPAFDKTGLFTDVILLVEDVTEHKLIEEALQHRLALEQMIAGISTRFIITGADELDNEITRALKIFGDFEDAKISYIEIFSTDKIKVRKKFEVINREETESIIKDDLEAIYIPIIIEDETAGFFRFYHSKFFKNWFEHDIELTKLLGEIIINALIRKNNELSIKLNENRLYTTLHSIGDAVIATDTEGIVVMLNKKAEDLTGWEYKEAINKPVSTIFNITPEVVDVSDIQEEIEDGDELSETYDSIVLKARSGTELFVSVTRTRIEDNKGAVYGEVIVFRDITQKKLEDDEIRYISFHDKLTGIYNRAFFEVEMARLNTKRQYPITLILGDCNGLKIANDIFGHLEGDKLLQKIAAILKSATRKEDIVARWGGDEFAIILPKTDEQTAAAVRERILKLCEEAEKDPIQLSIALGSATKTDDSEDIVEILKLAEDRMYRHKLLEGKSARNAILASIEKMIYEKSYETEEHAKRMIDISTRIGNAIGLSDYELEELSLLSVLHDLGKIGIPDSILTKTGKLDDEEWELMKKHPEKGYNIAKSTLELNNIAEFILHHHEHWDGNGYPAGLKGERIPKLSRILTIIDAYDVITHSRSYKSAQSNEEALNEIMRCAGTQFDPELSKVFVEVMKDYS